MQKFWGKFIWKQKGWGSFVWVCAYQSGVITEDDFIKEILSLGFKSEWQAHCSKISTYRYRGNVMADWVGFRIWIPGYMH